MSDGYDERMVAFAKEPHPTPDQCVVVVMDLLQAVKNKRWDHKGLKRTQMKKMDEH